MIFRFTESFDKSLPLKASWMHTKKIWMEQARRKEMTQKRKKGKKKTLSKWKHSIDVRLSSIPYILQSLRQNDFKQFLSAHNVTATTFIQISNVFTSSGETEPVLLLFFCLLYVEWTEINRMKELGNQIVKRSNE